MGKIKQSVAIVGLVLSVSVISFLIVDTVLQHRDRSESQPQSTSETVQLPAPAPTPERLLEAVNKERLAAGSPALTLDARINGAAQRKADELETTPTPDDNLHVNAQGVHGYSYTRQVVPACLSISENIAYGLGGREPQVDIVKIAMEGWLRSAPHKKAMLNAKYDITGFGISNNYIVEHFCDL